MKREQWIAKRNTNMAAEKAAHANGRLFHTALA